MNRRIIPLLSQIVGQLILLKLLNLICQASQTLDDAPPPDPEPPALPEPPKETLPF